MIANKELNWVNAVKAISMLSIYFIHTQSYYGIWFEHLNIFIHPYYVNVFFIVSGYLFFKKQLSTPIIDKSFKEYIQSDGWNLLKNIFFKLYIPMVLFSIIEFIPKKIIKASSFDFSDFIIETIGGGTYWFISALILIEITSFLLLCTRIKKSWFYFISLSLLTILGCSLCTGNLEATREIMSFRPALLSCSFFGCGVLYYKFESILDRHFKPIFICVSISYLLIFGLCAHSAEVLVSLWQLNLIGYVGSVLGSIMIICCCKLLKENKLTAFLGRNTLMMYLVSGACPILILPLFNKIYFHISDNSYLGWSMYFILCILTAILVAFIVQKYIPALLDVRKLSKRTKV